MATNPRSTPSMHRFDNRLGNDSASYFSTKEQFEHNGLIDYSHLRSLPQMWEIPEQYFGNVEALIDPHSRPAVSLTYRQVYQQIRQFAAGIQTLLSPSSPLQTSSQTSSQELSLNLSLGPSQNPPQNPPIVALFADNSWQWLVADQGIMLAGAADAVRSATADPDELLYILEHSQSSGLVVENAKTLDRLGDRIWTLPVEWVVLLSNEQPDSPGRPSHVKLLTFDQLLELGNQQPLQSVNTTPDTLATLIYTSGTTGQPKGVMLSHANFIYQLVALTAIIQPLVGDRTLSILPTWHSFGRVGEYYTLSQGCTQVYTNRRYLKQDLKTYQPAYVVGVPRLWESIFEGIQKSFRDRPPRMQAFIQSFLAVSSRYIQAVRIWKHRDLRNLHPTRSAVLRAWATTLLLAPLHYLGELLLYKRMQQALGGKVKQLICGGGSLAQHLEDFFEMIGIEILVGYGLTETSPVLSARRYWNNVRQASGQPLIQTEFRVVDLETRQALPAGKRGLVLTRGPQIMQGYYRNPEATTKAIDPEGWFDTGDIGWLVDDGSIVLTGRAKDTIVLSNGENIEPQPIEDACLRSLFIDQIVLVGQDRKALGALIVPNLEALQAWGLGQSPPLMIGDNEAIAPDNLIIHNLLRQELNREVRDRPGYRSQDEIAAFALLPEPMTIKNGLLTQTLKIRRNVVMDRYSEMSQRLF
ncbi:MAG: AMP-binding protein [Leptolyngbyaceae cyanobacterium]